MLITTTFLMVSCWLNIINMSSLLFLRRATSSFKVILGRNALNSTSPNELIRTVSRLIRHPAYNINTLDNDIGLVKLSSPVTFTDYIRPVCLAAYGSVFEHDSFCWATGWGHIKTGSKNLFFISRCIVCSEWLYRSNLIEHLCTRRLWCD